MDKLIKIKFKIKNFEKDKELFDIKLMYLLIYCLDISVFLKSMFLIQTSQTTLIIISLNFIINNIH